MHKYSRLVQHDEMPCSPESFDAHIPNTNRKRLPLTWIDEHIFSPIHAHGWNYDLAKVWSQISFPEGGNAH